MTNEEAIKMIHDFDEKWMHFHQRLHDSEDLEELHTLLGEILAYKDEVAKLAQNSST